MTTMGPSGQVAIGTPAFMAPEQLAAERVTAAADMWSWAVTMVFAGTGGLPFRGESLTATAFAILHSEPAVGRYIAAKESSTTAPRRRCHPLGTRPAGIVTGSARGAEPADACPAAWPGRPCAPLLACARTPPARSAPGRAHRPGVTGAARHDCGLGPSPCL